MKNRVVCINNKKIEYSYEKKDVKKVNIKVDCDNNVKVSAPNNISPKELDQIITSKAALIIKYIKNNETANKKRDLLFDDGETIYFLGKQYKLRLIQDVKNDILIKDKYFYIHIKEKYISDKNYVKKYYEKWLKDYSKTFFTKTLYEIVNKNGISFNEDTKIEVSKMDKRWGSYNTSKNTMRYNVNLIKAPVCCIEYVIMHEVNHLKEKNHTKAFYQNLTVLMPDWQERKKYLDENYGNL